MQKATIAFLLSWGKSTSACPFVVRNLPSICYDMEALIEKYGFNDEQVSDIKKLVVDSFQEMLPIFMKDAIIINFSLYFF